MGKLSEKTHILDAAGYRYNFDRMMYVNRNARKAFSVEFVEDRDEADIAQSIREANSGHRWRFYFNSQPSEGVKSELERVLG